MLSHINHKFQEAEAGILEGYSRIPVFAFDKAVKYIFRKSGK